MVCPYCSTRNIPNSAVCSHCGAILRQEATAKHVARRKWKPSAVARLIAVATAAVIGAAAGGFLAHTSEGQLSLAVGIIPGALIGALLIYIVSGARVLYLSNLYRAKHTVLQSRIRGTLSSAVDRYDRELKAQQSVPQTRLKIAVAHLLQDEIEKSVQEFQQAQRLGAKDLDFFNNAGVALARRGSLPQSVEMFERAAAQNGHSPQPHSNLAHVFIRTGTGEGTGQRAIQEVQQTLKLDGKNPAYYNRLGLIFCREKRYDEAIAQFKKALELAQGNRRSQADAHNNIGVAQFGAGREREAAGEFATALRLDSGHGYALCNQGLLQVLQGETDQGLEKLQNAAMLDSKSGPVHANLGYALCRMRAINEGILKSREAILLDTYLFDPHYNLGKAYTDEKLPEIGERYLTRALSINPNSWEALVATGVSKIMLGQVGQAVTAFQAADKIAPRHPLILTNLGVSLALADQYGAAELQLQQAAKLDGKNPEIFGHVGWLNMLQDNVSKAAGEIEEALQLDDRIAILQNNYGLCQVGLGSYDIALQHFRRALSLDPDLGVVHYNIGGTYALLKNIDQAQKEWDLAAKAEPTNIDCHVNLGAAYYRKAQYDDAVNEFRRVIAVRQDRMEDFSNLGLSYAKQGLILRQASRNPQDEKAKQAVERATLAIDMFDRALALNDKNVMLHSNRGLACYFANRPEEAMAEWTMVTQLDPMYARRRGKAQQSEFDDSQVDFVLLSVPQRAVQLPIRTADYLYQLLPGYDTDEWDVIIEDAALAPLPEMFRESRYLERSLQALKL